MEMRRFAALVLVAAGGASQGARAQAVLRSLAPSACRPTALEHTGQVLPFSAVRANEWTDLFDRNQGWTGADGVYSVPLDGVESSCTLKARRTLFFFSDTFIGDVDGNGMRSPGSTLINNSIALLTGPDPDPLRISFQWDDGAAPAALIVPPNPSAWIWPLDGIARGGELLAFALHMESTGGGAFGFAITGIDLVRTSLDFPFATNTLEPTSLFRLVSSGTDSYGRAVLPNTSAAGAPRPDGFVYVYGLREVTANKELLVSRTTLAELDDFDSYRFFDGQSWTNDLAAAVPIGDSLSSEFSVTPLADGRFLLVGMANDFLGGDVTVQYAPGPEGPFGAPIPVWDCPEPAFDPDVFVYGAKAHPHLSRAGTLLISYHVNTFDFFDHFTFADIYRPRFVELALD